MKIKEIDALETWQIRHAVMWPNQPFEFVQLEEDNSGLHFGVFTHEKLVQLCPALFQMMKCSSENWQLYPNIKTRE